MSSHMIFINHNLNVVPSAVSVVWFLLQGSTLIFYAKLTWQTNVPFRKSFGYANQTPPFGVLAVNNMRWTVLVCNLPGISENTKENSWHNEWRTANGHCCLWSAALQLGLLGWGVHEVLEVGEILWGMIVSLQRSAEILNTPTSSLLDPRCGAAEPPRPLDPRPVYSSIHH